MMEQACKDAASWPSDIQLAINVSAIQFKKGNLFDVIVRALLQSGLSPQRLQIEVTETALLENHPGQLETFRQLKSMGIALVLDDFGTGYSSLALLRRLPLNTLKIDKSFVQGLTTDENDAAIVRATIELGHNLGLKIVAEGVEDQATWDALAALGCDIVQGYLLSRPIPPADLTQWMRESPWGKRTLGETTFPLEYRRQRTS